MTAIENPADPDLRVAFVCVQNAGRSQMSAAIAERVRSERGLEDRVAILTGGTHPADAVHSVVIEVMDEQGVDLSGRTPRKVSTAELETCRFVATMGCSTLELAAGDSGVDGDAAHAGVRTEVRDWALDDPDGQPIERVREICAEIEARVEALFDEIGATID